MQKLWFIGLVCTALTMAACGDDKKSSGDTMDTMGDGIDGVACDTDTTGPTASSTPASPIMLNFDETSTSLSLTFDEDVVGVDGAVTIDGGAAIDSVTGSGSSYTVAISGLEAGNTYGVTVSAAAVTDGCGNTMAADLAVEITLTTDPCLDDMDAPVVTVGPSNPIDLPPTTMFVDVTFGFDEETAAITEADLTVDNGATIESVTLNNFDVVVRVSSLAEGRTTLTLPGTTADVCGNAIGTDTVVEINVEPEDQTPPMVMSTVPADMAVDVSNASTIEINFTEPVDTMTGSVTVDAAGTMVTYTQAFSNNDQTLTLTPDAVLPYDTAVTVTVSSFSDVASTPNTMAMDYVFGFQVEVDPCLGIPMTSSLTNGGAQAGVLDPMGDARVTLTFSDAFALEESMIAVTPTNGGAGTLTMGSIAGGPTNWTVSLAGAAVGDTYDIVLADGTSTDTCTALTGGTISYTVIVPAPIASGPCTSLPTVPNNYVAKDLCDEETNNTFANSEGTGMTLSAPGDVFSISSFYDSDGSDFDYFAFDVLEDGVNLTDIRVTIAYGCAFSGTGTPGAYAPIIALYDDANTSLGSFTADDNYDVIDGSGNFGFGSTAFELTGAAGTNTYHLRMDDNVGSGWCMETVIYVEFVDNTRPFACQGLPTTVALVPNPVDAYLNTTTTTAGVSLPFDASFALLETDITVTATNGGTGSLLMGSLAQAGNNWNITITGGADGDTYDVTVADRADMCSSMTGGTIPVTLTSSLVSSGACPLPAALAQHHAGVDACDAGTNSTFATSEATGFTLASPGDAFSIGATYDADTIGGGDNDYFSFSVTETGTTVTDLRVSVAYGCNFTGTGTRGAFAPLMWIRDNSNTIVDSFTGNDDYSDVDGSGNFGFGTQTFQLTGAAGTNTYHFQMDDDAGSNWCMDYVVYVEHVDNTFPLACLGSQPTAGLVTTNTSAYGPTTTATVSFEFDSNYTLSQSDLTLVQTSGTGTLVAASLTGGPTLWSVDLTGTAPGDTYELQIAANTDMCGSMFAGGSFTFDVDTLPVGRGTCPLPPVLANNYVNADACDAGTNSTSATAAATGFTLTNVGDAFSISGIYDSDSIGGGDNDWYAFSLVSDGMSSYDVTFSMAYGCAFTGTGTLSGTNSPDVDLIASNGTTSLGAFLGNGSYADANATSIYGQGGATFTIAPANNPAGTNTFYVRIDDVLGSNWCMDYNFYVKLNAIN